MFFKCVISLRKKDLLWRWAWQRQSTFLIRLFKSGPFKLDLQVVWAKTFFNTLTDPVFLEDWGYPFLCIPLCIFFFESGVPREESSIPQRWIVSEHSKTLMYVRTQMLCMHLLFFPAHHLFYSFKEPSLTPTLRARTWYL